MSHSLFPKQSNPLMEPQFVPFYNPPGLREISYLPSSGNSYFYYPNLYTNQPVFQGYYRVNSTEGIDLILIAILILVSMDLIFVRPFKR